MRQRLVGPASSTDVAQSLNDLAMSHRVTGQVAAAVKLAGRRSSTGGEHVNIKVAVRVRPLGEGLEGEGVEKVEGLEHVLV